MAKPELIEQQLQAGAEKARAIAAPLMKELRYAVGLRDLRDTGEREKKAVVKKVLPVFKQYRENDGKFYFKFLNAHGDLLLQSQAFESPKAAGECIAELKVGSITTTQVEIIGRCLVAGISESDVVAALKELHAAAEEKH